MSKIKSLANLIANLESTAPKDYDPEDILEPLNDNNERSDQESDNEESGAREHYLSVGKSKLRSEQPLLEDPRYAGKRSNRKDIYSDEEVEDEEEEEEEDFKEYSASEDDDEQGISDSDGVDDDEDLLANANSDEEDDDSGDSDDEDEKEGSVSDAEPTQNAENDDEINTELRRIQEEEKQMISQLSKSALADVEKGQHVRQQLTMWDNCLENRIRMQKVVDETNKLPQIDNFYSFRAESGGAIDKDLENAKKDLREVIDDLMDIRANLFRQNGSIDLEQVEFNTRKRHLGSDQDEQYIDALWHDISQINDVFVPFRNSTLEKWSNKVQVAAGARLNKKFKAFDQNILSQIESTLSDKSGLIKRTQLQRSDYNILGKTNVKVDKEQEEIEAGKKPDRHLNTYDVEIFDDQDFYQQQLRELIESRMVDTDDPLAIGMRWAARKQTEQKKKKKTIDRKASKGRQLRFNIHEKLQNFMVPIPVGDWHESMVEELYTSLLGQRLGGESLAE